MLLALVLGCSTPASAPAEPSAPPPAGEVDVPHPDPKAAPTPTRGWPEGFPASFVLLTEVDGKWAAKDPCEAPGILVDGDVFYTFGDGRGAAQSGKILGVLVNRGATVVRYEKAGQPAEARLAWGDDTHTWIDYGGQRWAPKSLVGSTWPGDLSGCGG